MSKFVQIFFHLYRVLGEFFIFLIYPVSDWTVFQRDVSMSFQFSPGISPGISQGESL